MKREKWRGFRLECRGGRVKRGKWKMNARLVISLKHYSQYDIQHSEFE